jgi:hypothetical protein
MRIIYTLLFCVLITSIAFGQLPSGTTSPDFNLTDINGQQHHLYSYLNQGKTVILDFSAAWCPLCWNYHNTHALDDFYTLYGPGGTDEAMVLFIEKDQAMGMDDLNGLTQATAGDWITGTPYPIIDNSSANGDFQPNALPTIYGIHPDKKLYHIGKLTTNELYDFVKSFDGLDTVTVDTLIDYAVDQISHVSCHGFDDGAISLSVSGPGTEYMFEWNSGELTNSITGLEPTTYVCTITDNLGNSISTEVFAITEPDTLELSFLLNTPSNAGNEDGSIIAQVMGGTAPYTFTWNNGSPGPVLENIGQGIYSLQVIDANGCQISDTVNLFVPTCALVLSINVQDATCLENADGNINLLVDGGVSPISFEWNNGATTQNLGGLVPGGYEVTVTDNQGCSAIASAMINENDETPPLARIRKGDFILYLDASGTAQLSADQVDSNSVDNCAILDMQLSKTIYDCTDLGTSQQTFTVIDRNLNLTSRSFTVIVFDTVTPAYFCPPDTVVAPCDGIVHYNPPVIIDNCTNGSRVSLNGRGTGHFFPVGLHTETYTYTDGRGNSAVCSFTINVEKHITPEITIRDASCANAPSGSAAAAVPQSDKTYQYTWNTGQTTPSAVNLFAGKYTVTISEPTECTFIESVTIGEPVELFIRLDSIKAPEAGKGNVHISIFGGTPPYSFAWKAGNETISTDEDPQDLPFGTYTLELSDNLGCVLNTFVLKVDETTPLREVNPIRDFKIIPNPTFGAFKLAFPPMKGSHALIELFSITGKRLFSQKSVIKKEVEVDPGYLRQGIYLVKVTVGKAYMTKRLVVKN